MAKEIFIAVTNFKDIYRREPVRDKSFVMPFGKWQGIEIGEVMQDDPDYLMWLVENTDFDIHADLMDEMETTLDHWRELEGHNYPEFWK